MLTQKSRTYEIYLSYILSLWRNKALKMSENQRFSEGIEMKHCTKMDQFHIILVL